MSAEPSLSNKGVSKLLASSSFLPLLVKAVSYAALDSYVPLWLFCLFAALVTWGRCSGSKAGSWAIRAWALAIILWGLAPINDAHVEGQFTAWYVLFSIGHIALGVYLYQHSRSEEAMLGNSSQDARSRSCRLAGPKPPRR